jgi:CDP-diacylglycerol--serine O-phosphatidyltransferase
LLGIGVFAGLFTSAPWPTLTFIGAVYVASIPLTMRAHSRLRRAAEARKAEAAEAIPAPLPVQPTPAIPIEGHPPANEWRH